MIDTDVNWAASWIGPGSDPRLELGVFGFRRRFSLDSVSACRVRVSADQRYRLFVNGVQVAFGPQRGDLQHWFYETLDLAPFLKVGENEISAVVWNFGRSAPMAQHTARTAFVLQGLDLPFLSTPGEWEIATLAEWDFELMHRRPAHHYCDVGPGEILLSGSSCCVDGQFGVQSWRSPQVIAAAEERGHPGGGTPWMLVPRSIPLMRYEDTGKEPVVRRGFLSDHAGADPVEGLVLRGRAGPTTSDLGLGLRVRGGESVLLDFRELLCAFPRLRFRSSAAAKVMVTYEEGLWTASGEKGNRDEVLGKESRGMQDCVYVSEGETIFEPLWWRTYRYVQLDVLEGDVELLGFESFETGYPLAIESSFEGDDPSVRAIWEVSVRTAERCAGETYFDCPYYEQLQYVGDTRIQALIGYYLGRDRSLQRNAIETIGWSIMPNGLTQSRYPSRQTQVIPTFSFWWVVMLGDQLRYDGLLDRGRRDQAIPIMHQGKHWAAEQKEFWQFTDWVPEWSMGVAPGASSSTVFALLRKLASMSGRDYEQEAFAQARALKGQPPQPYLEGELALQMQTGFKQTWAKTTQDRWKTDEGLLKRKHDPSSVFSEHAEALFRLIELESSLHASPWPREALAAANAAKCTFYFDYYKHLAMFGAAEHPFDYLTELEPWRQMIEDGLTTFAENPEPTRSDCHAWSAHPILGFFQIVAGVTSVAPEWKRARIAPQPGKLRRFAASIAHPGGELSVQFEDGRLVVDSPVPFDFRWRGESGAFEAGRHSF